MTTIIVTHENNEVDEHVFEPEIRTITIGRRSTNDVCVPNLSVSGTHAKIMLSDSGAMVEDLNSTNGTYINGRLISRQLLKDGEDIVMGRIRITYVAAPADINDDSMLDEPLTLTAKAETADPAGHSAIDAVAPRVDDEQLVSAEEFDAADSFDGKLNGAVNDDSLNDEMPVLSPPRDVTREAGDAVSPHARQQAAKTAENPTDAEVMAESWQSDDASEMHELAGGSATTTSAVIEIKNGAKSGQVLPIDKPVTTLGRPGIQIAAIMKKPDGYFLMHIESDGEIAPPQLNNSSIGDEPVLLQSGDALNVAGIDVQFMLS